MVTDTQGGETSIHFLMIITSANVFARQIITEKPETEYLIYNYRQEALDYLSSIETKDLRKEK